MYTHLYRHKEQSLHPLQRSGAAAGYPTVNNWGKMYVSRRWSVVPTAFIVYTGEVHTSFLFLFSSHSLSVKQ